MLENGKIQIFLKKLKEIIKMLLNIFLVTIPPFLHFFVFPEFQQVPKSFLMTHISLGVCCRH